VSTLCVGADATAGEATLAVGFGLKRLKGASLGSTLAMRFLP
jgi:hypothetical protein